LENESGKFQTKTGSQAIPNHTIPSHTKPNQALPSAADADQTDPQTTGVEPVTAGDGGDAHGEPRIENFQTQEPDRASPGLQGKKSHSASDGESGDPWARQRQRLFVQLQTILRLDPLATDKAGQDAYLRAAQAILSQIDQIYADCQAKGKRWEGIEKRLVRFAGETRKDRQKPIANPIGFWLSRCKKEFFTI
jgi:hypothetical protein